MFQLRFEGQEKDLTWTKVKLGEVENLRAEAEKEKLEIENKLKGAMKEIEMLKENLDTTQISMEYVLFSVHRFFLHFDFSVLIFPLLKSINKLLGIQKIGFRV